MAGPNASNEAVNTIKNQLLQLNPELANPIQPGQAYIVPDANTPQNMALAQQADKPYLAAQAQAAAQAKADAIQNIYNKVNATQGEMLADSNYQIALASQNRISSYVVPSFIPTPPVETGLGVGFTQGGGVEAGMGSGGAYQINYGEALFYGKTPGLNAGAFLAEGGFSGNANSKQFAVGATGGVTGLGGFVTNAVSAQQLLGPFDTWTLSLPIVSIQYAKDPTSPVWTAGVGFGKSYGFAFSRYSVDTTSATETKTLWKP